jgi:hypothetical protein
VLVNSGDIDTRAAPPNQTPLNHMILFLPKLNLYVDPTLGVVFRSEQWDFHRPRRGCTSLSFFNRGPFDK